MTALDRALIKAYRAQHGGTPARAIEPSASPEPAVMDWNGVTTTLSIHTVETTSGPYQQASGDGELISTPQTRHTFAEEQVSFRVDVGIAGIPASRSLTSRPVAVPSAELDVRQHAPMVADTEPAPSYIRPPVPAYRPAVEMEPQPVVHLTSRPLSSFAHNEMPADEARPRLIVERFLWPETCDAIRQQVGTNLDQFIGNLIGTIPRGGKAIAFAGLDHGAGVSSVTLCVARELAAQGLRPLVVDADFARPSLAGQLSLQVHHGWDAAVLGRMPLGEILIQSTEDHIVLAPLIGPTAPGLLSETNLRATLIWRMLKHSYDVLLFDVGAIDDQSALDTLNALSKVAVLDDVYAVCDRTAATQQEIVAFMHRAKTANLNVLGIVENYARDGLESATMAP